MRVLLVQPNQEQGMGLQNLNRVEPLGLEMIAGALQGRHEVAPPVSRQPTFIRNWPACTGKPTPGGS